MDYTIRQMKELVKHFRKEGATEITIGELTVKFPFASVPTSVDFTETTTAKEDTSDNEENVLFWSSSRS